LCQEELINLQLHGKPALITGSSSGLGEAIASLLPKEAPR
jgi:NAD(P)-dependent dehydrogenase (short-subunit alcohol dehydrogenase family)